MSKKKNKPCITKDEIRKVLEETIKDCFSYPEWWHFCEQESGLFYWEHEDNKGKIGARLKPDSDVWEIYHSINDIGAVYIIIHPNIRSISWEGNDIKSTLQPYMYKAFVKLSELIKDESTESKVVDTSEIKMEGEKEMENKDNYIKMDGEKDSFEGGAIRYTKKGKGRYDLIPSQQIHDILDYAKLNWDSIVGKDDDFCSIHNVLMSAYPDADDLTYDNYIEIIINIIRYSYIAAAKNPIFNFFMIGFVEMLKELAIHYEMGAEKYGVDNWKNGIPETKGERGGSFRDSGLRHLQQLLDGKTDEPHQIAAIWNFIGAMYVKKHQNTCENCDDMKNSDCSEISNGLKDLQRKMGKDCDQDTNKLINAMLVDTVIDLSHPDPDMKFQCFLMGNIHTNNFGIVFNPNDMKDWHIFNKDKVSITVFREYCNNLECDRFEITGIDIHGVQCKLNIDRSSITNLDSEFNVKVELSTALEVKQAPQEVVLYKFDFRSTPKKIPKDLWDRFYYNFLSNAVEVRPV